MTSPFTETFPPEGHVFPKFGNEAQYVSGFETVPRERQEGENLCWAAVALALCRAMGRPEQSQREIVIQILSVMADVRYDLGKALSKLELTGDFDSDASYSQTRLRNALASDLPGAISVLWEADKSGHAICVIGHLGLDEASPLLMVYNPSAAVAELGYLELVPLLETPAYKEGSKKGERGKWVRLYVPGGY